MKRFTFMFFQPILFGEKPKIQVNNLSFGLCSSDLEEFASQKLGFSDLLNGQGPLASLKSTRDASKVPKSEGVKPKIQVNKEFLTWAKR
jgi:hypothetical protein